MVNIEELRSLFISKFGTKPRIFRAPGRINLIGEHTDYNDGFVLPCAIDRAAYVAAAKRADRRIRFLSANLEAEFEVDLDFPIQRPLNAWAKYVQGVALVLERQGHRLNGADLLIKSDVPIGAGLSSSAALEIASAFALASLSGREIGPIELARIGHTAEHEFAGVRSGIMDQFISVLGKRNHALLIDCRSLQWTEIPVSTAQFLVCNTMAKHDLAEGEYNKRREECEVAARHLGVASLRDVSMEEFDLRSRDLPVDLRKRARHVISENRRVLDSADALRAGDLERFGSLIDNSHASLRDDFEVSCRELDLMVEITRKMRGVLGSRMIGGGFGGCTISLVKAGDHTELIESVSEEFQKAIRVVPEIYQFKVSTGVAEELNN